MIATNVLTPSSPCRSTTGQQRQAGRRCRRSREIQWGSPSTKSPSSEKYSAMPRLTAMACFLVMAVCSTTCVSFTMPIQRTQHSLALLQTEAQEQRIYLKDTSTSLFSTTNGIAEESVSNNNNCEILKVVDDDFDESASSSPATKNPAFKNTAESPAPPLNFEKYLTMQKKRVPVTIRYSAESGLKPYYLTVAKRVKDLYPDVIIERVEIAGEGTDYTDAEANGSGTFEVEVDGKMVVRKNERAGTHAGSIFVSMAEMDLAITRARKRRRPSTVYGEDGKLNVSGDIQDDSVKSRLEVLKQKATELQRQSAMSEE